MARPQSRARSQARKIRAPLSLERIVEAALDLIEEDGLAEFSTRKLAAVLGCEAMSIYHYFPSKAHLMDALLDRVVAGTGLPPRDLPWIERLRQVALFYRAAALRNPRFFQFAVLHRMNTPTGLGFLEEALRIFKDAGFDTETSARLFRSFGYYIAGASLDEAAGYSRGPSAAVPVPADIASRDFPLVTAVNPYFREAEREATFLLGLDIMLDGIKNVHRKLALRKPPASGKADQARVRRRASP